MTSSRPGDGLPAGRIGDQIAELVAELAALGRSVAAHMAAGNGHTAAHEPRVLSDRADGVVVRVGDTVVKAHAEDTDVTALDVRLRIAADPRLRGVMLAPVALPFPPEPPPGAVGSPFPPVPGGRFLTWLRGRPVTVWPAGEPVNPEDPDAAPWEQAGTLLARLHATTVGSDAAGAHAVGAGGGPFPPMRGPGRVARALDRLRAVRPDRSISGPGIHDQVADVLRAATTVPAWARGEAIWEPPAAAGPGRRAVLVHGDWHFGQMVRPLSGTGGLPGSVPAGGPGAEPGTDWQLIDVDDLGTGDPAWDLARPAAWYAAGLLEPQVWERFLKAYHASHGCAVPPDGNPWPVLDVPARALTVQSAALGIVAAVREDRPPDEAEEALIDACRRITRVGHPPGVP